MAPGAAGDTEKRITQLTLPHQSMSRRNALELLTQYVAKGDAVYYYVQNDDEHTIAVELASILTGDSPDSVKERLAKDRHAYPNALFKWLSAAGWMYGKLETDELAQEMRAFERVYDKTLDIAFIDSGADSVEIVNLR